MQAQPPGAMLSVRIDARTMETRLPRRPVAGGRQRAERERRLGPARRDRTPARRARGRRHRRENTAHVARVPLVDDGRRCSRRSAMKSRASSSRRRAVPIVSTRTGACSATTKSSRPTTGRDTCATRCASRLRCGRCSGTTTCRCSKSVRVPCLRRSRASTTEARGRIVLPSLGDAPERERSAWLGAAGQLWSAGVAVSIADLDRRARRQRVRLPTYPFERRALLGRCGARARRFGAGARRGRAHRHCRNADRSHDAGDSDASTRRARRAQAAPDRRAQALFEDIAGLDLADADADANFMEFGLDSLALTQVALQLQKTFPVRITFRELMESLSTFEQLADAHRQAFAGRCSAVPRREQTAPATAAAMAVDDVRAGAARGTHAAGDPAADADHAAAARAAGRRRRRRSAAAGAGAGRAAQPVCAGTGRARADDEAALAHSTYDVKKAFGAIARIHTAPHRADRRSSARASTRSCAATSRARRSPRRTRSSIARTWPIRASSTASVR